MKKRMWSWCALVAVVLMALVVVRALVCRWMREEDLDSVSPDGRYAAVVYSDAWKPIVGFGAGDSMQIPGKVELVDKSNGRVLACVPIEHLANAQDIEWGDGQVRISRGEDMSMYDFRKGSLVESWNDVVVIEGEKCE